MKTYLKLTALLVMFFFLCGSGLKEEKEVTSEKKPESIVLYSQDFEKEDETDAWASDNGEIEWQKGGPEGSKGCLKVFNPGENCNLVAEKYLSWYDEKSVIEFDYFLNGLTDELYLLAHRTKMGQGVRLQVKSFNKGKWCHASLKAANLAIMGKSGKTETFRNLIIVASGVDKDCKDPYILLDNIVIRTNGLLPEKKPVTLEKYF